MTSSLHVDPKQSPTGGVKVRTQTRTRTCRILPSMSVVTMSSTAVHRRSSRSVTMCRVILLTLIAVVDSEAQRVKPLFEIFATYGRPALAASVADAYAPSGGIRAGGGVGAAVGALVGGVEIAAFYEFGSASIARAASSGTPRDLTRSAAGLRLEAPLAELGREFRGIVSGSLFVQTLDDVTVARASAPTQSLTVSQTGAIGARAELGVEHRGFIGTTWFVTGGVAAAGAGRGAWQENTTQRGGIGVAPIITLGLRTRTW